MRQDTRELSLHEIEFVSDHREVGARLIEVMQCELVFVWRAHVICNLFDRGLTIHNTLKERRGIDRAVCVLGGGYATRLSRINYNYAWYTLLIYCIVTCTFTRAPPWVIEN